MPPTNPSTLHPNPSLAALPYNPALALWLSVDPLSDKYPNLSPYVYCANNPVKYFDPNGREWVDIEGNKIKDHSKIKVYIFYDPNAFGSQSKQMYKDAEKKYGKGSVAMSNVTTIQEFAQDWHDMASGNIKEVNLNYHGGPQTINLDWRESQYLTSTETGKTPRNNPAMNVSDLPTPSGNISGSQLNINSCQSNNTNADLMGSGKTIAQSFRDNTAFMSIRTTAQPVSYFYLFSHDRPHPSDDSDWQFLYRPTFHKQYRVGLISK